MKLSAKAFLNQYPLTSKTTADPTDILYCIINDLDYIMSPGYVYWQHETILYRTTHNLFFQTFDNLITPQPGTNVLATDGQYTILEATFDQLCDAIDNQIPVIEYGQYAYWQHDTNTWYRW